MGDLAWQTSPLYMGPLPNTFCMEPLLSTFIWYVPLMCSYIQVFVGGLAWQTTIETLSNYLCVPNVFLYTGVRGRLSVGLSLPLSPMGQGMPIGARFALLSGLEGKVDWNVRCPAPFFRTSRCVCVWGGGGR